MCLNFFLPLLHISSFFDKTSYNVGDFLQEDKSRFKCYKVLEDFYISI